VRDVFGEKRAAERKNRCMLHRPAPVNSQTDNFRADV